MKRLVGTVVGLAVLVLVAFVPAAFYGVGAGDESPEVTTITKYVADFTLDDQGDLRAVETLTVDFPVSGRHGIFRFWDIADQSAPYARRVPHDISVTMDGGAEPFEVLSEEPGPLPGRQDRVGGRRRRAGQARLPHRVLDRRGRRARLGRACAASSSGT